MEEILKYENRQKLYQFLINSYGFKVIEEKNYMAMGYSVKLSSDFFLLRYYYDRMYIDVDIASHFEDPKDFYSLSFIQDLLYNPDSINARYRTEGDNIVWINNLNNFLRNDFDKICELLDKKNSFNTRRKIAEGCEKQSYIRYPSTRPKS